MKLTWIEQIFRQDAEQSSAGRVLKVQRAHLAPQPERAAAPRGPSLRGAFFAPGLFAVGPPGATGRLQSLLNLGAASRAALLAGGRPPVVADLGVGFSVLGETTGNLSGAREQC